jgi:hypothetical protein
MQSSNESNWETFIVADSILEAITLAVRSKAWTIFPGPNTGIMSSIPIWVIVVGVRFFSVCVVLCIGSSLATGWSPVQRILPTVYKIKKVKSGQCPTNGCRAIDRFHSWCYNVVGHRSTLDWLRPRRRESVFRWEGSAAEEASLWLAD